MSIVTASALIPAPPESVWAMVMDPEQLHAWVTVHRKLIRADEGPPRVGFQMHQRIHLRGVNLDVHWKLIDCRRPALAVWEGRGPARSSARTEYALCAEDGGTRFDYRNEFRAPLGPLGAMVSRALVGGMPDREAKRTLERLSARMQRGTEREN